MFPRKKSHTQPLSQTLPDFSGAIEVIDSEPSITTAQPETPRLKLAITFFPELTTIPLNATTPKPVAPTRRRNSFCTIL